MNLAKYDRKRYIYGVSPIEYLSNLSEKLGGPNIYIKRDDKLNLSVGGNKVRKLEFLMADAVAQKADTIITCGAVQSNHCALTLAAAIKEKLKCQLILEERVANSYNLNANGNNFLYRLMGVEDIYVVPGGSDMMAEMQKLAEKLKAKGRKPYIVPGGGSNSIGALGYLSCALEILSQTFEMGINIDKIVVTSGSGGTHSGLLAGMVSANANIPIIGIGVNKRKDEQRKIVWTKANEVAKTVGSINEVKYEDVIVFDDYIGEGYSIPTDAMIEAVRMLAREEAILLDPVYTGKSMSGLIDLVRKGYFKKNENVLFIHTGGSSALYAYKDVLLKNEIEK